MFPLPVDMRPFYEGGYQEIPNSLSALRVISKKENYRMEPILKYKTGGSLLEIGPWMGIFSCNAKDAGFDVTAIDIDQQCVDFLNDTVGVKAFQSADPAKTLADMTEKFDVIALWHSLEHLPRPWLVVQRAAERLNPGGLLVIAIPNIESLEFAKFREAWLHLDAPRHLYFYPEKSLVELCRERGLIKLESTTTDELSRILSLNAWWTWVSTKLPVKYVRRVVGSLLYQLARNRRTGQYSGSGLTAVFQRSMSD
jgi:SAM-dependent methyltransferase